MHTIEIFNLAYQAFSSFLEKIPNGSCNMYPKLKKFSPSHLAHAPEWVHQGKELCKDHYRQWSDLQAAFFKASNQLTMEACKIAYDFVMKQQSGNCSSLAASFVWHLSNLINTSGKTLAIRIEILETSELCDMDHAFIMLNRPLSVSYKSVHCWTADCIVVDPWLRQIFTADKWLEMMTPIAPLFGWHNPLCPNGFVRVFSNS